MELTIDSDVLAARQGDRDAFARLVTRYRGLVSSISLSTVRNVAVSEDVAQDVFLAAWRDLGSLRNTSSFVPWLRQMTRNRALDAARGARRPDRRGALDDAALEVVVDPSPDAREALLRDERAAALAEAFDALPDDAREAITLYYREGRSVEQVARLLGLREDAVKKRLSRARESLRAEVLARFGGEVEASAPTEAFNHRVLGALPSAAPAAAGALMKGVLSFASKWIVAFAIIPGFFGFAIVGLLTLRRLRDDLANATTQGQRRALWALTLASLPGFAVLNWALTNTVHTRTLHFLPQTLASWAACSFFRSLYKRVKRQGRAADEPSASSFGALRRWLKARPQNRRTTIAVILWLDLFLACLTAAGDERSTLTFRVSFVIVALVGLFRASQIILNASSPHRA